MAIGFAWLMGYYLKPNFNSPYVALNITDFWRRWHISLSSWLRDYIYIPLGGNRKGEYHQYLFLMVTMLIGGFWHGADWKFVWWGGMHGLALVIHKLYLKFVKGRIPDLKIFSVISWIITFHFVAFMWLFFRAASFGDAMDCIKQIFGNFDLAYLVPFFKVRSLFVWILMLGFLIHLVPQQTRSYLYRSFTESPLLAKAFFFVLLVQVVLQIKSASVQPFIYFQF
jgi:D-alanyl-lipoteichoic acid acyltransferase DltB (MBOAT superfamily)